MFIFLQYVYLELFDVNIYGCSLVGHSIFSPGVNVFALPPTGCSILFHKPIAAAALITQKKLKNLFL